MPKVFIKCVLYSRSKHFQSAHVLTCRKTQQHYLSHTQQYTLNRIINSHCNSLCNLMLLTVAHSSSAISSAPSKTGSISSAAQSQRPRRRRSGGKVARSSRSNHKAVITALPLYVGDHSVSSSAWLCIQCQSIIFRNTVKRMTRLTRQFIFSRA
jgi:hypothetical protein